MKIYGDLISGNCYKVKLLCAFLDIRHDWVPMDILAGDCQTEEFLEKNPAGKIPLLALEDGRFISESNAILYYLSYGSDFQPVDRYLKAKVFEWMFFEQYSHEPFIAVRRFIRQYQNMPAQRQAEYDAKYVGGEKALMIMEQHLAKNDFLVGSRITIADIALYAYTQVADEAEYDLGSYPGIQAWLDRIVSTPGYEPMPAS